MVCRNNITRCPHDFSASALAVAMALWVHVVCLALLSVPFLWTLYPRKGLRKFYCIWGKRLLGLNGEMIRTLCSKVTVTLQITFSILSLLCQYFSQKSSKIMIKWWHFISKGQRLVSLWHHNVLQKYFSVHYSMPNLRNRRADGDHFSLIVRCVIGETNLGWPPLNSAGCCDLLCCQFEDVCEASTF